ncbi:hypothetical protein, partial [Nocardioides aquiterrae]|uniref:hypothetical protein n=1 Tax=Nocardioides aquiterrae TaxID=203799 RepID=UPI0031D10684
MRRLAGIVLVLAATACSPPGVDETPTPATPRPTSVVRATQDPAAARLQALARLAESAGGG